MATKNNTRSNSLKIVPNEKKSAPLDSLTIEQIIERPIPKVKLTPPHFKLQLVDNSSPGILARILKSLYQEDAYRDNR
jgi:hypothetical protein